MIESKFYFVTYFYFLVIWKLTRRVSKFTRSLFFDQNFECCIIFEGKLIFEPNSDF